MYKLTIALQSEMTATIQDNTVVIDISDNCSRDLWKAQLELWLEKIEHKNGEIVESLASDAFLRIGINGKLKYDK